MQISIPVRCCKNRTAFLKQCLLLLVFSSVWGNWGRRVWFKLGLCLQLQSLLMYYRECCFPGDWAWTVVCVSSDLPAVLSGALTLLRLEKPPVLHSSDSATCDSLCVLGTEPSGYMLLLLIMVVCNHLRTNAESLQKRVNLLFFGTHLFTIPVSRGRGGSSADGGWLAPALSPRTYLSALLEADVHISERSCF